MSRRGVSTVVDVSLALLFISASVLLVGTFLTEDDQEMSEQASDHVGETLATSTTNVSYSLESIRDAEGFPNDGYESSAFQRQRYGSLVGLMASNTMLDVTIEGKEFTEEGDGFDEAVEGGLMEALTGTGYDARVTTRWRPYEGASITGTETYGRAPPGDADVQTITLRVPSGVDPVARDAQEAYNSGGYRDAADTLAGAIVQRYYPPEEMQLALERQRFERALVVYRYQRMETVLSETAASDGNILIPWEFRPTEEGAQLSRTGSAVRANENLTQGLGEVIEEDLEDNYTLEEMDSFADSSSIEYVLITIEVWKE